MSGDLRRQGAGLALVASLMVGTAGAETTLERVSIGGDAIVRWLQVDVDDRAPGGLYGEPLEQTTAFIRRLRLDVTARVNDRVSAGGRLRLSNEPEIVLQLGPEYYARAEGSVFIAARTSWIRARAGFYEVSFTPFTLMRWDARDLGLGGAAGGCACAGATTGTRIRSLEETGRRLTFEGGRADGTLLDVVDWTALYARPHAANLESPPGFDGVYALDTFRHHEDLYAARVTVSRFHAPSLGAQRIGATTLYVREDDRNPALCPANPSDEICQAAETTLLGLDADVPLGAAVRLGGEWLRTAHREDHRTGAAAAVWANAFRAQGTITTWNRRVRAEAAWLRLERGHESPYGALTYRPNRQGVRVRVGLAHHGVTLDLFARKVKPIVSEEYEDAGRPIDSERMLSVRAEVSLVRLVPGSIALGWQVETVELDLLPADDRRRARRDVLQLELRAVSDGLEVRLVQQLIDEEPFDSTIDDGHAALASLTLTSRF